MPLSSPAPPRPAFGHVDTWVFDLDNTLYPAACNLFEQVDQRMGAFIANLLKVDMTEARRIQKHFFRTYGTTLNGLMTEHGMDPDAFLDYVHDIDHSPVPPDPRLEAVLARLPGRKVVYTNGTVRHAEKVMARIGVDHHFADIFDIVAAGFIPKPNPQPYRQFITAYGIDPARAAMFEDIARNLKPAAEMGMVTVLVSTTNVEWAREGADEPYVHHRTDHLADFLEDVLRR